jgi:hypothetical protein
MAKEIRADPAALIELAAASLAAADRLGSRYRSGFSQLPIPETAFGAVPAAADAHLTAHRLLGDAHEAIAGLAAVLEGDADRLLRTAFAYREADRQADARIGRSRRAGI